MCLRSKSLLSKLVISPNKAFIHAKTLATVEEDIDPLKTSVSEGKALVAAAVTDKGVQTAADASFQTIAYNIEKIELGIIYDIIYQYSWDFHGYDKVTKQNYADSSHIIIIPNKSLNIGIIMIPIKTINTTPDSIDFLINSGQTFSVTMQAGNNWTDIELHGDQYLSNNFTENPYVYFVKI